MPRWSVAVFGHNEARRIGCCLRAIAAAADGHPTRAIVILNGTTDESATVVRDIASKTSLEIELHTIAIADKSNAINQFLYLLRPEADLYAFVDAYAEIGPQALNALAAALRRHPDAMAVSGVPMNGRSSRSVQAQTLGNGVLNGQLFALRPDFVRRLTARGIRIPFGLYRGDGLLGSMAAHDLDPIGTRWDASRIRGVAEACFMIAPLSPFRPADLRRQARRMLRQARGTVENAAIRAIIGERGYEGLPAHAGDMVRDWLRTHELPPGPVPALILRRLALSRPIPRPGPAELLPRLVFRQGL